MPLGDTRDLGTKAGRRIDATLAAKLAHASAHVISADRTEVPEPLVGRLKNPVHALKVTGAERLLDHAVDSNGGLADGLTAADLSLILELFQRRDQYGQEAPLRRQPTPKASALA